MLRQPTAAKPQQPKASPALAEPAQPQLFWGGETPARVLSGRLKGDVQSLSSRSSHETVAEGAHWPKQLLGKPAKTGHHFFP